VRLRNRPGFLWGLDLIRPRCLALVELEPQVISRRQAMPPGVRSNPCGLPLGHGLVDGGGLDFVPARVSKFPHPRVDVAFPRFKRRHVGDDIEVEIPLHVPGEGLLTARLRRSKQHGPGCRSDDRSPVTVPCQKATSGRRCSAPARVAVPFPPGRRLA